MTASASSSKLSLSSLNYRQTSLLTAGIAIDSISWLEAPVPVVILVKDMLDFRGTIPPTSSIVRLAAMLSAISIPIRVDLAKRFPCNRLRYTRRGGWVGWPLLGTDPVVNKLYGRAQEIATLARRYRDDAEAEWTPVIDAALKGMEEDSDFYTM
jgi:hypothetical protein